MSSESDSVLQENVEEVSSAPSEPQTEAVAREDAPEVPAKRELSNQLKVSIGVLSAGVLASILLLMFMPTSHLGSKVFFTLSIIVGFVLFTLLDFAIIKREIMLSFSSIVNMFIMVTSIIVVWVYFPSTTYVAISGEYPTFHDGISFVDTEQDPGIVLASLLGIAIIMKGINLLIIAVSQFKKDSEQFYSYARKATMVGLLVSGVMIVIPIVVSTISSVEIGELYYKFVVAIFILTALAFSITTLLNWFMNAPEREVRRQEQAALKAEHDRQAAYRAQQATQYSQQQAAQFAEQQRQYAAYQQQQQAAQQPQQQPQQSYYTTEPPRQ